MKTLNATNARKNWYPLLKQVARTREAVIIQTLEGGHRDRVVAAAQLSLVTEEELRQRVATATDPEEKAFLQQWIDKRAARKVAKSPRASSQPVVSTVGADNQLRIPGEIASSLKIAVGDQLVIRVEGQTVFATPIKPRCQRSVRSPR